jgi:putative DNA primase/helicase
MSRRFEGTAEEDTSLSDQLAGELEGVLVRAIAGLQRLMGRQRFAFPSSVERAREQYRQTLDTVRAFITEECHFDPDAWIDRAELYRRYKEWCREGGRYDLAAATFNARLPQAYPGRIGQRTRRGRPGWRGLDIGVAAPEGDRGDEGDEFPT